MIYFLENFTVYDLSVLALIYNPFSMVKNLNPLDYNYIDDMDDLEQVMDFISNR